MTPGDVIQKRYEIRGEIGRGGMGVVYRAFDTLIEREVAIKTVLDVVDPAYLRSFQKEWAVLASVHHPNIVEIYDIGEVKVRGVRKPFFVMPLLNGSPLDRLIHGSDTRQRLDPERIVDIAGQVCRGLQAAHDRNLIHRDVKPSNILVLGRNAVKLIDFGIVHLTGGETAGGAKGTPFYMAPEQLRNDAPTPQTDIFALGVVCYEAFTRRRPFTGATEREVAAAVERYVPPPAHELNPEVSEAVSRVVHKAMAKKPFHRFRNASEMEAALIRALHDEAAAVLDAEEAAPRIRKAERAIESREFDYADEILAELEAEGFVSAEVRQLRKQLDAAVREQKLRGLLGDAERYLEKHEATLALRRVELALDLDPENTRAAAMKTEAERRRRQTRIEDWLSQARKAIESQAYGRARRAVERVREMAPSHPEAERLLAEISHKESERNTARSEKQRLFEKAQQAHAAGDGAAVLSIAAQWRKIDAFFPDRLPERSGRLAAWEAEARKREKESQHEERARRQAWEVTAVEQRILAEPDLELRLRLIAKARERYPGDARLRELEHSTKSLKQSAGSLASQAAGLAREGEFERARGRYLELQSIHPQFPGLADELLRLEQARQRAQEAEQAADELQRRESTAGGAGFLQRVQEKLEQGSVRDALDALDEALRSGASREFRSRAAALLVRHAQKVIVSDWRLADGLLRRAVAIDPDSSAAGDAVRSTRVVQRSELAADCLRAAHQAMSRNDLRTALEEIEAGLKIFPNEPQLLRMREEIERRLEATSQRSRDLATLRQIASAAAAAPREEIDDLSRRAAEIAQSYPSDSEVRTLSEEINKVLESRRARRRLLGLFGQ